MRMSRQAIVSAFVVCLVPASTVCAGIAMDATGGGGDVISGGRGETASFGITEMVVRENNSLNQVVSVTDPTTTILDGMEGFGVTDVNAVGYLQEGPHDTLLVFDILAAQTLMQLIGFDKQSSEPLPVDAGPIPDDPPPIVHGASAPTGGQTDPPPVLQEVPEPASAVLLGMGVVLIASSRRARRARRNRP